MNTSQCTSADVHNQPLALQKSNLTSSSSHTATETPAQRSNGSILVSNALKSLFGGNRPRSLSVPSERESGASLDISENGLSFGSSGQTMLNDPSMGGGGRIVDPTILDQRIVDDQEASMLATPTPASYVPSMVSFRDQSKRVSLKGHRRPSTASASSSDPPTVALQPAPRKRWTSSGMESPVSGSGFSISNRNSRHVEDQGEGGEHLRSSLDTTNTASTSSRRDSVSKRWSRTLPQRLTPPPASSLPALPGASDMGVISSKDESTPSPSSSRMSMSLSIKRASLSSNYSINGSGHASMSNSSVQGKRASMSSAYSTGTSGSRSSFHMKRPSSSSGRQNVPPPRPAPTSALPRPPTAPSSTGTGKRSSATMNLKRLSLALPMKKPPPLSELPPRPDEDSEPGRIRLMSAPSSMLPPIAATPTPTGMERRMSYVPPPDPSSPEDIPPPRLETQPSFPKLKALSPPPRKTSSNQPRKDYVTNTETFAKRSTVVRMQPTLSSASEDSLVDGEITSTSDSSESSEDDDDDEDEEAEAEVRSLGPG